MTSSNNKQYGLIIPKKFNINEVKRASVFNNESDSEDDSTEVGTSDWIKKSFQKQAAVQSGGIKRQTEIDMKRALAQDPSVYKYDEIYDELEEKKKAEETKKKSDSKKPRYIQNLLKTAQHRKLENERRIERQVQKERDAEGEQFKDKETFVTSAYKKKLEEFHKLDEEERRKDMLEEICDVSKQQDLGGFYRHLYKSTVDKDKSETKDKENISKDDQNESNKILAKDAKKNKIESRQYRKRKTSDSSSLEEGEHDSDSDTSIGSTSSSASSASSKDNKTKKLKTDKDNSKISEKCNLKKEKTDKAMKISEEKSSDKSQVKICVPASESNKSFDEKDVKPIDKIPEVKEEKPKINIWEKRTVGLVFEAALERYFKRKAERLVVRGN